MSYRSSGTGAAAFVVFVVVMFIGAAIGAFTWPYTINTWLTFLGKEPVVVWWQGSLLGFVPFVGHASIPASVITWVLMLFIG